MWTILAFSGTLLISSRCTGIFNGFTFYQLGNTIGDLQNRMFTSFLIILIPPTIVNAVVPKFYQNMSLWRARELPSRIYGWFAFTTLVSSHKPHEHYTDMSI